MSSDVTYQLLFSDSYEVGNCFFGCFIDIVMLDYTLNKSIFILNKNMYGINIGKIQDSSDFIENHAIVSKL